MKKLKELKPNIRNPRQASDQKLDMLRRSIEKMGSLDGFIENERTGNMVSGHQRQKVASPDTEIIILERYEKPTEAGTLAYGYLVIAGERFPYRLVDWDEDTEKAGLVAANKGAGQWNYGLLADVILELDAINFDLDFTLFEKTEIANIMDGRSAPEPGSGSGGGDEKAMGSLSEKFLIAPFSVLNAREGWWQNRKRAWISLGIESEKGRGGGA